MSPALPTVLVSLLCAAAAAADEVRPVFVALKRIRVVGISTGKPIETLKVAEEGIIGVQPVPGDPSRVLLGGVAPGQATVRVKDKDGKEETWQVTVGRSSVVFTETPDVVSTASGKAVGKAENQDPKLMRVEPAISKSAVRITGLAPGDARLVLTDAAGKSETVLVQVRSATKPDKSALVVAAGQGLTFQMASKKAIALVLNESDDIIKISTTGSPRAIVLEAKKPGVSRLFIMDEDNGVEEYEILARPNGQR